MNQKGQIIVIVLLVTLIALSLGLVVTQKTITDVTTSTQNDQASRAFSAAEAGIERAYTLSPGVTATIPPTDFDNQASADNIQASNSLPSGTDALEYPPIGREAVANFWLSQAGNPDVSSYTGSTVNLYFGNSTQSPSEPKPAVEITFFYKDGSGNFQSFSEFYDSDSTRATTNGFTPASLNGSVNIFNLTTFTPGQASTFYAYVPNVSIYPGVCSGCNPILARVRLLYSTSNQKIALGPVGTQTLPAQANAYQSTGKAGQSQKSLKVFKESYVVPHFFDFAIFSVGDITK